MWHYFRYAVLHGVEARAIQWISYQVSLVTNVIKFCVFLVLENILLKSWPIAWQYASYSMDKSWSTMQQRYAPVAYSAIASYIACSQQLGLNLPLPLLQCMALAQDQSRMCRLLTLVCLCCLCWPLYWHCSGTVGLSIAVTSAPFRRFSSLVWQHFSAWVYCRLCIGGPGLMTTQYRVNYHVPINVEPFPCWV